MLRMTPGLKEEFCEKERMNTDFLSFLDFFFNCKMKLPLILIGQTADLP